MNGSKHYLLNLNIITSHAKALYTNTFDTIFKRIFILTFKTSAKHWSNYAIGAFEYRLLINTIYIMQTDLTTSYPCHGMYPSYPFDTFHVTSWHQLKYEYFIRWPPLIALIIFIFYFSCHHGDHQKKLSKKTSMSYMRQRIYHEGEYYRLFMKAGFPVWWNAKSYYNTFSKYCYEHFTFDLVFL